MSTSNHPLANEIAPPVSGRQSCGTIFLRVSTVGRVLIPTIAAAGRMTPRATKYGIQRCSPGAALLPELANAPVVRQVDPDLVLPSLGYDWVALTLLPVCDSATRFD